MTLLFVGSRRSPPNAPLRPSRSAHSAPSSPRARPHSRRSNTCAPSPTARVLINDPGKRQVILLDTALANPKVVVDSAGGATMYGMGAGALIPFAGDSTLFVDRNASAFLVIDAKGDVARVMSAPPGNAATYLTEPVDLRLPRLLADIRNRISTADAPAADRAAAQPAHRRSRENSTTARS